VIAADPPAVREGVERFNDSFEVGHDNYLTTTPPDSLHLWVVPLSGNEPRRLTTGPGRNKVYRSVLGYSIHREYISKHRQVAYVYNEPSS
jgi:hypothetical protein